MPISFQPPPAAPLHAEPRTKMRSSCALMAALAGLCVAFGASGRDPIPDEPTADPAPEVDTSATLADYDPQPSGGQELLDRAASPAAIRRGERLAQVNPMAEERRRIESLLQQARESGRDDEAQRLQQQLDAMRREEARQSGAPVSTTPGEMPPAMPLPEGALPATVDPHEKVLIRFGEAVDLKAFADFIATRLSINIFPDAALQDKRVFFTAPVEVEAGQLLRLLQSLLEDQGFALVYDDELKIYKIVQAANIQMGLDGEQATTRVIQTPMLRPSALQATIQAMLQGAQGGNAAVRMSPIDELGVLVVTATPSTADKIEQFVQRILKEFANYRLFNFPLTNVAADHAVQRVLTLNGRMGSSTSAFVGQPGVPNQPVNPGIAGGGGIVNLETRLFADAANSVIFRGTEDEAEQIGQMISIVDSVPRLIAKRYVAGKVAQLIAETGERIGLGPMTFATSSTNQSGFNSGFGTNRQFGSNFGGNGQQSQLTGSGFVVDLDTASIIYYGTEPQHEQVADLVRTFTEQSLDENIELQVYKLKYIEAKLTADLLNEIIKDPSQQTFNNPLFPRGNSSAQRAAQQLSGAVDGTTATADENTLAATSENTVIVADESGNQLLIKATARAQKQFATLIDTMDQRKPQVHIQAKIVVVDVRDDFDWTADVQFSAGQFAFLSTFGLTGPATALLPDIRTVPGSVPGATAALIKSDFVPFAINALETMGNARVVSNPRILVNDNYEADMKSTREEPFLETQQTAGNPLVTSQGGTAEAGTTLKVKPRITAAGDLVLSYTVELSDFDLDNQQAGLQPPKNTNNYTSEVTLPSDSTVVVGGFTFDRKGEGKQRVPVLGWIPILGALFTDYSETSRKTLVFVFITPNVLNDKTFQDLMLISQGWMEEAGVDPDRPPMEAALMRASEMTYAPARLVPRNEAPQVILPPLRTSAAE